MARSQLEAVRSAGPSMPIPATLEEETSHQQLQQLPAVREANFQSQQSQQHPAAGLAQVDLVMELELHLREALFNQPIQVVHQQHQVVAPPQRRAVDLQQQPVAAQAVMDVHFRRAALATEEVLHQLEASNPPIQAVPLRHRVADLEPPQAVEQVEQVAMDFLEPVASVDTHSAATEVKEAKEVPKATKTLEGTVEMAAMVASVGTYLH